ncbi:MAG: class I SAM-dependent methyltransferase [Candidatus Curtissbacteria bacterium]|nr:class I SAM-dependent methyltransferase [Candidatus Curtissbacteria bacterium]
MQKKISKVKISGQKLKDIWAQVPPDYYDRGNLLQKLWHNHKLNQVIKLLPKQKGNHRLKVLDIGCNSALLTNEVSKVLKKGKITGLDSYKGAIDFARSKYPHINFVVADAHKLPFNKNSLDLVICTETLEHVVDPKKALEEMVRILKKDARAIISMDSGSPLFHIIWHVWTKGHGKVWQNAHLHEFNAKLLEQLIRDSGFKIQKKIKSHLGMAITFLVVPKK